MKYIQLSRGYETAVDSEIFDVLIEFRWHAVVTVNNVYARRCINGAYVYMHHQILNVNPQDLRAKDLMVDHKDKDSLNNTRSNLRVTTRTENVRNSSAFKNRDYVYFHKQSGKYCVVYNGLHMGQYPTHEEAHKASRGFGLCE